ncbi:MAG TPA: N-acetylmuramoyl-L-alanine amidase, partial [Aliiroseovarius sp.]|nr:N-acetylmuramoyl-L-alanine amidase [Aliiroseovarius sp.]
MHIHAHPSPNHTARRDGLQPRLIVLHFTAMATCDDALARLCAPEHEVSAHYLISNKGDVFQMVEEHRRAWHAGAGAWGGVQDINSRSLGIELDNTGATPFAAAQMDALEQLMRGIMQRWAIPAAGVIGHSDMAPLRKADPGRRFDWRRLALGGLSVWP